MKSRKHEWLAKIKERDCKYPDCHERFIGGPKADYCLTHRALVGNQNRAEGLRRYHANRRKAKDWTWCEHSGDLVYPCPRHDKIFKYKCGIAEDQCPLLAGKIEGVMRPSDLIREIA